MRKPVVVVSCILCTTLAVGAWASTEPFKSDLEKNSYAIGVNMIKQLKARGSKYDVTLVSRGVKDGAAGKSLLTAAETDAALKKMQEEAQKAAREQFEKEVAENKKRGEAFLADYAKREGVKGLKTGVMYRVLQRGSGPKASTDDILLSNYRGTLVDGKEFHASAPGKPGLLKLRRVVPGLREALMQMPVGSKWEIVIPAEQGYGERGTNVVGPYETLIYEVELLGLE